MNDLTEQWQKGELPSGWYYTKLWKGCNVIDKFIGNQFLRYDDSDIVEVITPVPTFDEWQKILHYAGKYECEYTSCVMDFENLKAENNKLKELLKRVVNVTDFYHEINTASVVDHGVWYNIANEINQALGEDK